jgi:hypothetical protein
MAHHHILIFSNTFNLYYYNYFTGSPFFRNTTGASFVFCSLLTRVISFSLIINYFPAFFFPRIFKNGSNSFLNSSAYIELLAIIWDNALFELPSGDRFPARLARVSILGFSGYYTLSLEIISSC